MPIDFHCPHCGAETLVDERFSGQAGHCATCGKNIFVPLPSVTPDAITKEKQAKKYLQPLGLATLVGILGSGVLLVTAIIAVTVQTMVPAYQTVHQQARSARCDNNLQRIGMAMHMYHASYGCFPPAYISDESGKPMHSWRVLLLPFLDEQKLFRQYDFNSPWDSPRNMIVMNNMPSVYGCPYDPDAEMGETSYHVISGPGMVFDRDNSTRIADIKDDLASTILVVEVARCAVPWHKPSDLDASRIDFQVNAARTGQIGSRHPQRGASLLTTDGKVHFLNHLTSTETVRAMVTIDGGERVPDRIVSQHNP